MRLLTLFMQQHHIDDKTISCAVLRQGNDVYRLADRQPGDVSQQSRFPFLALPIG